MSSNDRRAVARRKAWGRGPTILRFEPLEGRQLLSTADPVAALSSIATVGTTTNDASATNVAAAADATGDANLAATASANAAATVQTNATVNATTTATPNPVAPAFDGSNLTETTFDTAHNLDWGDTFPAIITLQNMGSTETVTPYAVEVFASTSPRGTSGDLYLGAIPVPAGIAAGAKADFAQTFTSPPVPLTGLGTETSYYLIPKLVPLGTNEAPTPARTAGTPVNSVVTITPRVPPKLVGAGISLTPGSVAWGDTISVTASVKNDSQGAAPPTNARIILTPTGQQPGGGSDYQIGQVPIPPIGAFQTVTATQRITLPVYAPTGLGSSTRFTVTMVQDADAAANPLLLPTLAPSAAETTQLSIGATAAPVVNAPPKPAPADLTVTAVQEPSPVMFRGATFPVGATIQNNGDGDAGPFKVRFLLVTDESANAPAFVLGDALLPGLGAHKEQDVLQTVTLPYRTPDGFAADSSTARIVAEVDPDRSVDQSNPNNDRLAAARVQLKLLSPDGQTTVPILPGGTTTATGNGTTTVTPPGETGGASNFATTTVAANAVPAASAPATTAPAATTPASPAPTATARAPMTRAAARRAAAAARAAARAAAAAKAAMVHTQVINPRNVAARQAVQVRIPVRNHALKVYHPVKAAR